MVVLGSSALAEGAWFVPPGPALFGQLVQEMSGSMVSSASNSAALATFLAAKRRERIISHSPSHVGAHFKKELASSSFETSFLFDDEVVAKVVVASREDSHLEAQLSIAKAFTLPVFCGSATGSGAVGRPPLVRALQPLFFFFLRFSGKRKGFGCGRDLAVSGSLFRAAHGTAGVLLT